MIHHYAVVIVGGEFAGATAVRELNGRGQKIYRLEAKAWLSAGSSQRQSNMGITGVTYA